MVCFGLLVEVFLKEVNALPVVVGGGLLFALGGEMTAESGAVTEALKLMGQVLNGVAAFDVEEQAGVLIANEVFQAADATCQDRFASAPGFEGDDAEGLVHAGEYEGIAGVKGIEKTGVIVLHSREEMDGVLELVGGDGGAHPVGVVGLCFGTDEDEACLGIVLVKAGEGFDEDVLVFLGIDAADVQGDESVLRDAVLGAEVGTVSLAELLGIDPVWQVGDAIMVEVLLGRIEFTLADADDHVSFLEDAARAEKSAEDTAPFQFALDGSGHGSEFGVGNVEHAAMEGDDEGFVFEACRRGDRTTESLQGVGMEQADVGLTKHGAEEGEGEQVAAFFVECGLVCGAEAPKGIAVAMTLDRDAADGLAGMVGESHGGHDFGGETRPLLLAGDFGDDRLGAAPFMGDEAPWDVDDGGTHAWGHIRRRLSGGYPRR